MTNLSADDLKKMASHEVSSLADLDAHAVREEGFRRQAVAEKKISRLQRQLLAAQREMADASTIIQSAFAELAK